VGAFLGSIMRVGWSPRRCRNSRINPMINTAADPMAIAGKLLASGRPTENRKSRRPNPPGELGSPTSEVTTKTTTKTSGGCTIGPNRLRRCAKTTAATHPATNAIWKIRPSES